MPFSQYLPFTLRYGSVRLRRPRFGRYSSPVKSSVPRIRDAGDNTVILCNACILTMDGSPAFFKVRFLRALMGAEKIDRKGAAYLFRGGSDARISQKSSSP